MRNKILPFFLFPLLLFASLPVLKAERIYGGYYTEERITHLRNNCQKYPWARQMQEEAIEKAAYWLAIQDKDLWAMVPGQDLPRCIDVTFDRLTDGPKSLGCLTCGEKIKKYGNYPYTPDFENLPWKLTCPSCKSVFPTNDFGKYYESAIGPDGQFDPSKGDKTLLYNEDHPDPNDPLHTFGVDDGMGYIDGNGRSHRFIGYYSWKYWMFLYEGLEALSDGFLFTGDKIYAQKAAILLDRIADVYPEMDWKPYADMGWYHSDGGTHLGKIEGSIWETVVVQKFAESYDKIISGTQDLPELYALLKKQSEKYQLPNPKGTRELFIRNVDNGILRTSHNAVLTGQVRGNQGMHQLALAMCAIALNTQPETNEWLDWLFAPEGGAIPGLMLGQFDRDGTSDEGAPGYSLMWGRLITHLASWLADYPTYSKNDIFEDYPQFKATFLSAYRMAALGIAVPNIGDSGSTGLVSNGMVDPEFMAKGFYYSRDPDIALAAYRANGNSSEGLGRNIFLEDPNSLSEEIKAIAEKQGPRPEGGYLMSGFGLALLESGSGESGTALTTNYGRTIRHGHPDMLNFDLFALSQWMTPDHGYPEFATRWPSNAEWTGSTLSHNTVYVDKQPQRENWGGRSRIFKQLKGFGMIGLDGRSAYPHLEEYNRTLFLISGNDADTGEKNDYVVDIFRVKGGEDHLYSFHGPPGNLIVPGPELKDQTNGTYAGEKVSKGEWATDFPIGYSHLYQVQRDSSPPDQFILDWKTETGYRGLPADKDIHLRLHALTPSHDLALAKGDPPQNKPGNPKSLNYALIHRQGKNLSSSFVSVIEPYKDKPFIRSVRRLDTEEDGGIALEIERMDGVKDYVLYNPVSQQTMQLSNGVYLSGTAAYLQEEKGIVGKGVLVNGKSLNYKDIDITSTGALSGKIIDMNKNLKGGGWLLLDQELPSDSSLIGQQIMIETASERDASYTIREIQKEGKHTRIFCGPISFVSGFKGETMRVRNAVVPKDYSLGYTYDFELGASFEISIHREWKPGEIKDLSNSTQP